MLRPTGPPTALCSEPLTYRRGDSPRSAPRHEWEGPRAWRPDRTACYTNSRLEAIWMRSTPYWRDDRYWPDRFGGLYIAGIAVWPEVRQRAGLAGGSDPRDRLCEQSLPRQ